MKKIITLFICLLIIIFIFIIYMDNNDNRYDDKIKKDITDKTDIKAIKYINKYDNYYIVADNNYVYIINNDYNELIRKDISLLHDNDNKYDIIYKDDYIMYFNNYMKDNVLVYEYYDINTYELIDRVFVGGNLDE